MGKYCCSSNCRSKRSDSLPFPVETTFKLPSPLPPWPEGEGFGSGTIDLGGLQVRQVSTFNKVWATYEGGPDNLGASFFEPSQIPTDFFLLGCYTQPNDRKLRGWVLVARDKTSTDALKKPIDYTLVWSSESLNIRQDGIGYFWSPTPPKGYKAVGHIVTNSQEKPSLEKVRCVRSDLTDECKTESWIWGPGKRSATKHFNVFSLTPKDVGMLDLVVCVGTFLAQKPGQTIEAASISMACMKNKEGNFSWMPNLDQIQALFQAYAPWIYLHPNEKYFPSSVRWFFVNGALLYKKGDESKPEHIEASGYNLPRVHDFYDDDGAYWIDLPVDVESKERIKKGNLKESEVYLHVKPIFGGTFTDVTIWIFYPFNGPARLKVCCINIPFRRIGEHVGDWEHLTLRVSNFSGELWSVYFSQHSRGHWVDAQDLEFQDGNKPVIYSSLHSHAMYSKPGLVLQGCGGIGIGIRNDTAKSEMVMDTGARFSVVAAEYLNLSEPPWLNYRRKWGPKISYGKIMKSVMKCFPSEMSGEEGPTGPMLKISWKGDEVVQ